jgi:hypothetical protein
VKEVRVHWPSGGTTTNENLPVDVTIEVVEDPNQWLVHSDLRP